MQKRQEYLKATGSIASLLPSLRSISLRFFPSFPFRDFSLNYAHGSPSTQLHISVAFLSSRDGIYNHFIGRVRNNLHIVLCMSPVGDAFRTRCRMFPSLVNCCTIDWFTEWPR